MGWTFNGTKVLTSMRAYTEKRQSPYNQYAEQVRHHTLVTVEYRGILMSGALNLIRSLVRGYKNGDVSGEYKHDLPGGGTLTMTYDYWDRSGSMKDGWVDTLSDVNIVVPNPLNGIEQG
jgi:hypothetical protein